jgi:hypothetical protein
MERMIVSNKIDKRLWKEFKKAVIDSDTKINNALEEAIKLWMEKKKYKM